jgi:hypothetical protein
MVIVQRGSLFGQASLIMEWWWVLGETKLSRKKESGSAAMYFIPTIEFVPRFCQTEATIVFFPKLCV